MAVAVSIFTCTYNMLGTLPQCIASALGQTRSDFEFLILDDGSTDGTWEYLKEQVGQDCRLKIYRNLSNQGLSYCRNFLLKNSQAPFYSILDADDTWAPQKLERHIALLENSLRIGVVWGKAQIYTRGEETPPVILPNEENVGGWDITRPYEVVHSATTWRKQSVMDAGAYLAEYALVEGPDLFFRVGDRFQQYYDPHLACTKWIDPNTPFRKELNREKRAELSKELLLNTIKRRHRVFLSEKPTWAK